MSLTKFGKKLLCFLALIAFGFAIVACTNGSVTAPSEAKKTAEEHVENIYNKIFWDSSAMEDISSNIVLTTNTMYEDTTVTWSSSHPDIISVEGVVTRPAYEHEEAVSVNPNDPEETAKHVAVRLRATITSVYEEDGKQKEVNKYKEFVFTVLTLAEGLKMTTIAEAKAAAYQYIYEEMGVEKALVSNPNVIYNVGVYGKVTAKLNAAGAGQFMIHDGTEGIYVYSAQTDLQIGDTVSVVGGIYSYYGNLQIAKDVTVTKVEKEIELPAHTEISVDAWEKSVADLSQIGYHGGKLYKLYAKLEKVEANVAKDVFKLTDPYTAEVAWIYYKSYSAEQEAILDQYNGKYVNITGVTYDRDSRLLKNHLMWDGGIEEAAAPTLSDEQKLGQVVASVKELAGSYVAGAVLELPVSNEEYGATIAWTIPENAPYANGKFALVDAATDFVATAVVSINGLEQTVEVQITVNPIRTVTVAEAVKLAVGSTVKLSGTIEVVFGSKGNYYLKDASGSLLVYVGTSSGIEVNGATVTVKAGDKVTLVGTTNVFNGCPQIGAIVSYEAHEAGEWEMSMPQEVSVADIKAYTLENAPYGQYLMVKGNLVKSGSYYYLADGEQQISLYNSTVGEKLAAVADTDTKVTLFVYFYGFQKADYSGDTRVIFNGRDGEFFIGDEPVVLPNVHQHVACPTCGKCTAEGCDGEKCEGHQASNVITLAQAIEIASKQEHNTYTSEKYTVTGTVNDLYNTVYGNMHLIDADGNDLTIYGLYINGQKYGDFAGTKPVEGDVITVVGILGTYNGKPQMKNAELVVEPAPHEHVMCPTCGLCTAAGCDGQQCPGHADIPSDGKITIAEALEIANKQAHNTYTTEKYTITGTVNDLYNTIYGNMHLLDGKGGDITIYGLYINGQKYGDYSGAKPVEGDVITVTGILGTYNGTPQMKNAELVVEPAPHEHVACPECGKCTAEGCDGEVCPGHFAEGTSVAKVVIADYAAANAWANSVMYNTLTAGAVTVTMSAVGGSGSYPANTGKYYTSGNEWRAYQSDKEATIVVAGEGLTIVSVKISYNTKNGGILVANGVNYESGVLVEVNASSVTFSIGNTGTATNGQVKVTAIEVTYKAGSSVEPSHEHVACPVCGKCTAADCDGAAEDKCLGHEAPKHEHVACPTCGKCTAADCDGAAEDKCAGHSSLPTEGVVTLAQAIEIAKSYAHNTYSTGKFTVTGTVNDLYNTVYGNMHLIDADGNDLTIYGLYFNGQKYGDYSCTKPVAGDVITVTGILGTYNGNPQMKNADFVEMEVPAHEHVACPTCGLCTAADCDGAAEVKCAGHEVVTPSNGGKADFETANNGTANSSYLDRTTANGWVAKFAAVNSGSTDSSSTANPSFGFLGGPEVRALTIAGGTDKVGSITSPVLSGGLSKLTFNYTNLFTDTKFSITVSIKYADGTVAHSELISYDNPNKVKYEIRTAEIVFNMAGDFVIEIVNNCPNGLAGNKDRATIWNLSWEAAANVEPSHEHVACPTCGLCVAEDCDGAAEVKCAGHTPVVVESSKVVFDDTAKRTEVDGNHQVWVENGVTVTVNKNTSTSAINEKYFNPLRVYKNHELVVTSEQTFSKVIITVYYNNGASTYIDALASTTVPEGATMSHVEAVFTFDLAEAATSFAIVMDSAQVRVVSVEVVPAA